VSKPNNALVLLQADCWPGKHFYRTVTLTEIKRSARYPQPSDIDVTKIGSHALANCGAAEEGRSAEFEFFDQSGTLTSVQFPFEQAQPRISKALSFARFIARQLRHAHPHTSS
jgi:hypothetical protein